MKPKYQYLDHYKVAYWIDSEQKFVWLYENEITQ